MFSSWATRKVATTRHDNGGARPQRDPPQALFARQVPDRHRDYHRVVAGQNQVDQDDAHDRSKELPRERNMTKPTKINHFSPFEVFHAGHGMVIRVVGVNCRRVILYRSRHFFWKRFPLIIKSVKGSAGL